MNATERLAPGTRVRVTGVPYAGREGVVAKSRGTSWEVWAHLDVNTHAVGFTAAEVIPLDADA